MAGAQGFAADEPHGVVGPAVGVSAKPVDRHDPRMLEVAGDLRFQHKAFPALVVACKLALDLLESDLAVQFLVLGHEHLAQAAGRVEAQHPEAARRRSIEGRTSFLPACVPGPEEGASADDVIGGTLGPLCRRRLAALGEGGDQLAEQVGGVGEARGVVLHRGFLAGPAAVVGVQDQQFAQEGEPLGPRCAGEEILQAWPGAGLPGLLEAAADLFKTPDRLLRQVVQQR